MVWAVLELLGETEIILQIDSFPIFLRQYMGSESLSQYGHMALGCCHCGLKVRTRGNYGYVGLFLVHQRPYPWLILVQVLLMHQGSS